MTTDTHVATDYDAIVVTPVDVSTEPDEDIDGRRIEFTWPLAEYVTELHREPATTHLFVVLRVTHYGKREMHGDPEKCYRAVLCFDNETLGNGWRQTAIHLGGLPGLRIADFPTERYSAKSQRVFAHDMLDAIRADENAEQVQAWLDKATAAAHECIAAAKRQDAYDMAHGLGKYSEAGGPA